MAWKYLGGKTRRYQNTDTGETISRRQYDKLFKGIESYEKKAAQNRAKDLKAAVSRAARGRTKATSQQEIEDRLKAAEAKAESDRHNRIDKTAKKKAHSVKPKKIRPQLLKTGRRAVRLPFNTWEEYEVMREDAATQKVAGGKRLITAYGIGIVGFDERTGRELDATLITLQSPSVKISEDSLDDLTQDFLMEHLYFIFSHYFIHLHYNKEYAESRVEKSRKKNIPKIHRKQNRKKK